MRVGVFSQHPERLLWYASRFPGHSFLHMLPGLEGASHIGCDSYIVDADVLTDDRDSYGDLTRYFNRGVMESLAERPRSPCLPEAYKNEGGDRSPQSATRMRPTRPDYPHTIFFQEKNGS